MKPDRRLRRATRAQGSGHLRRGGSIGGAVARAFAREGATVHLAGRTMERLEGVAERIRAAGGVAHTARVDALDERAVDEHADAVAAASGSVDVSLNVILTAVRTTFLTARAAARQMIKQRSGVILAFGGYGPPMREFYLGALQTAFQAIEAMRWQLACELGPHGIRVLTLQTAGVPESIPDGFEGRAAITKDVVGRTMLGRAATLEDVGNVAAFTASDQARTVTATALNITCGTVVD